jgi:glutathione S-transferase
MKAAMKLYYMPGACSLAPHIAMREAGMTFDLVRYDQETHALQGGTPLESVNDKGYVPVLELDGGERLTEVTAVLQYVADQAPATKLAPPNGTMERYRLQEWLNFIATEVHKSFWPFFHDGCEAERPNQGERLRKKLEWIQQRLGERNFLAGDAFTVADCYLVTVVNWIRPAGFDLAKFPVLQRYRNVHKDRPSVKAALEAEGLYRRG